MTTAYITDSRFNAHTLQGHVESAARLDAIHNLINQYAINRRMLVLTPVEPDEEQLRAVHTGEYLDLLRWTETERGLQLGPDTYVLPASFGAAQLSAGAAIRGVDAVLTGEAHNAFACARPPGHHATPSMGMGFCLLSNIAIAARHARLKYDLSRILIVDYDVHHGNGTQDVFYAVHSVMFVSPNQYPYYPGTGALHDTGTGVWN